MQIFVSNKNNQRKLALVSKNYALIFQLIKHNNDNSQSCSLTLVTKNSIQFKDYKKLSYHEIFGFIGLIEIEGNIFITTITGSSKIAQPLPNESVNKIYAVDFFCLNDSQWDFIEFDSQGRPLLDPRVSSSSSSSSSSSLPLSSEYYPESSLNDPDLIIPTNNPCIQYKKLLSNGSFYYSSNFDLTSMIQERGLNNHSLTNDNFKREFMWNDFMLNEIISYRNRLDPIQQRILDSEGFLTTVIRGFVESVITYIKDWKISLTIISKQSWKRAGTRYNVRGINDDGNVANFVETEFIMYSNEYCYAFTQIRGSVPIFWEQDPALINPKIQITRSIEATQSAFDSHFQMLLDKYGIIHIINLLSNNKQSEFDLTKRYRNQLSNSKKLNLDQQCLMTEFDFHKETSQDGFLAAQKILPSIKNSMLNNGYFSFDVKENKIISKQRGIFRTNCLDCLDRTNLVQQLISYEMFKLFIKDFNLVNQINNDSDYMQRHNILWADNGDQISQIYAGTNALKTSFTRKGKMSFVGAISDATKSVSRLYINNFVDKGKQQNIDGLLGRLPDQHPVHIFDPENDYITQRLNDLSSHFTTYSNMNLFVGTYNVSGRSNNHADLSEWLFPIGNKFKPDIVVLGLQEVIELTAGSILNVDYSKSDLWTNLVTKCLNQYDEKYILLRAEQMASLIILLFVKEDKVNHITQVEGSTKKTGFKGMTGNKGAVAIRFKYSETSFCFVNAHLSAGINNIEERGNDYITINKSISFAGGRKINQHDSIFWLGDLNYRISLDNINVRIELTDQRPGYIERLLTYDQLTEVINSGSIFQDFCEPTLRFHPTYKYDVGTDLYDTSEKARTPSWTDRIVYKGNNLSPLAYSDAPLRLSDHKPVFAAYRTKVAFIDESKKLLLANQCRDDYLNGDYDIPEPIKPIRPLLPAKERRKNIDLIDLDSRPVLTMEQESSYKMIPTPEPKNSIRTKSSKEDLMNKREKKLSIPPPQIPKRKSNLNITNLEPRPISSTSSLSTLQTRAPPPPISRSSVSLKSQTSSGINSDLIELKSIKDNSITPINEELKKRQAPAIPRRRKEKEPTTIYIKDEIPEYEDSLLLGHSAADTSSDLSSMLEMVIDSGSPKKSGSENDSVKPSPINILTSKEKSKPRPPVPSKKTVLNKINISK